jgi:hypothetical protein
MNDQDRFVFPEPIGEGPRRFTPLLAAAGAVGILALLAIVYVVFFGGGGGAAASPSPSSPSETVSTSPGTASASPTAATSPSAPVAGEWTQELCVEPTAAWAAEDDETMGPIRDDCLAAVTALLATDLDPSTVEAIAYLPDPDDPVAGPPGRLLVDVEGRRRIRAFTLVEGETGELTVRRDRARQPRGIPADDEGIAFLWPPSVE